MDEAAGKKNRGVSRTAVEKACSIGCALILAAALLALSLYFAHGGPRETVDLQEYTAITRTGNTVTAVLDIDSLLTDLHLPNPRLASFSLEDYPDVNALCTVGLSLAFTDDPQKMLVTVQADTDTLSSCGIDLVKTSWEGDVVVKPLTQSEGTSYGGGEIQEASLAVALEEGYLSALLDGNGNGLNLRSVCEKVQTERDKLCKEIFGNNYDTEKTQVYFIVYPSGATFHNCYRAVYTAVETDVKAGAKAQSYYFTVDILDLTYSAESGVTFLRSDVILYDTAAEAAALTVFERDGGTVTKLYGGGVLVPGKEAFDQNGFIKFPGSATSFKMANGVYWSPSYDLMKEDQIWQLTAVEGHSLANLLRYLRKEIYARHYAVFSENTEREFLTHYSAYPWYEGRITEAESTMTAGELSNIRLIREIQSLLEN